MLPFTRILENLKNSGYSVPKARTKIAHDVVLKAISLSGLAKNATVKGGVVMSDFTEDIRRATMDMDIDFVKYPLDDDQIDVFVGRLNCIKGVAISRSGPIVELRQRNYRGKRIFLVIRDSDGVTVQTKVDIGVHVHTKMRQKRRTFKMSFDRKGARLSANSPEQIFAEKLKSLLRFGARSERPKDVFDLCYLVDAVDRTRLVAYLELLVFSDSGMREKSFVEVVARLERTFSSRTYLAKLARADVNWLRITPQDAVVKILAFMRSL